MHFKGIKPSLGAHWGDCPPFPGIERADCEAICKMRIGTRLAPWTMGAACDPDGRAYNRRAKAAIRVVARAVFCSGVRPDFLRGRNE